MAVSPNGPRQPTSGHLREIPYPGLARETTERSQRRCGPSSCLPSLSLQQGLEEEEGQS